MPPCPLRSEKGKEEKTQAPPTMCYAGSSTGQASTTDLDCSHLRRRRAGRLACFEVEKEACWRGRHLHCTGRHPAAGSGRLRGGGAQEACWRGRRLHCTGRNPAAGSGWLWGGGTQEACWRGRPLHCTGRHPAARVRHLPSRKLYCIRATAWQPALAGCWRLRLHLCDASGYPPGCPPSPPYSPPGSPSPALLGPLTHPSAA